MNYRLNLTLHPYLVIVGGIEQGRFSSLACAMDSARDEQLRFIRLHRRRVEWEITDGTRLWTSEMAVAG